MHAVVSVKSMGCNNKEPKKNGKRKEKNMLCLVKVLAMGPLLHIVKSLHFLGFVFR